MTGYSMIHLAMALFSVALWAWDVAVLLVRWVP